MIKIVSKIVLILIFFPLTAISQNINMDKTIAYLNKKFDGICNIDTKKNEMIIQFYKGKSVFRVDRVDFQEIDTTKIFYDNDAKAIILKCYGNEKSVFRKIYQAKTKRFYSRINISYVSDSVSINGITSAFIHLIKLTQDDNYKNNKAFE